jgi:hypothetical protein
MAAASVQADHTMTIKDVIENYKTSKLEKINVYGVITFIQDKPVPAQPRSKSKFYFNFAIF